MYKNQPEKRKNVRKWGAKSGYRGLKIEKIKYGKIAGKNFQHSDPGFFLIKYCFFCTKNLLLQQKMLS